jgi:K+-transporting ATPase ATPase A chain
MLALTVQNFVSAATGMAVLVALIRGISRHETNKLGSFWADLVRGTLYILLPLSLVLALALVSQGVVQSFSAYKTVPLVEALGPDTARVATQVLPMGPAASQIAIKQLGTNGGGFFNINSAHPFENATPLSNFLEVLAILLIPAALCYTFGKMIKDTRQGWAILAAMTIVFVGLLLPEVMAENGHHPAYAAMGIDQSPSAHQSGGNMEGKEVRFGITSSAEWAVATTAASNGSVNSMHDSYMPLGGLIPLWLMQLGEIIYGGVGSGLYGMLLFAIVTVFIAGLMVGRTPEYLGKKIEAYEMKMASLAILIPNLLALFFTAFAVATAAGRSGIYNPGAHGFTEVLYAFSSMSNNNGSAFNGLTATNWLYTLFGGVAMWASRFWIIIPTLAVAGSLARKKLVPASAGTLPTHTPLFVTLLVGTVLLVGALTHLPGLALGPIVEHLQLFTR